jgi:Transposase DDE domain
MTRWQKVPEFVRRVLPSIRRSQQTTAADLLEGLLRIQRIGLATIARGMRDDTTVKHRIKRAGRFCQNDGIEMQRVFDGMAKYLLAPDRRNVIALDWTSLGDYLLLKASLIWGKRSVPLAWRCVWKWQYEKSQNDEEATLVEQLIRAAGDRDWVLVADRGFGRADFLRWLDERGVRFVIRVSGQTFIEHPWFTGVLGNIPRRAGAGWMYKAVRYRKQSPVTVNLACHHKEPAPEPWYLATNLDITGQKAASLYAKRMGIEEGIRDVKSGLGLKHLWLGGPERMERAMILIALAVLLAVLTGAASTARGERLHLSNLKRSGPPLSFFALGLRIIEQYPDRLSISRRSLHAG